MHVLVIPSWYATEAHPTRGVAFYDQAVAVRAQGHQVGLLVPPARLRSRIGLRETLRGALSRHEAKQVAGDLPGLRVAWWGPTSVLWRRHRPGTMVSAFEQYVDELGSPDVLHAHSALYGGYVATAIRERFGIPLVITEHFSGMLAGVVDGIRGGSPFWPDQQAIVRETYEKADHCLAVSEPLARVLRDLVPGQTFEVLGNCIDTDFFTQARPPEPTPFRFLLIGGLIVRKNIDICLSAFQQAFSGNSDFELQIVGVGPQRGELEGLARRLGIAARVQFLGSCNRSEVRDLVHSCHVMVSSSRHETFGVTLIEAMACGKPVIASRSGGPQTFVEAASGLLVEPGDTVALARAMRQIADGYAHFDQVRIRERCVARFSHDAIGSRLVAIYETLTGRRPTR